MPDKVLNPYVGLRPFETEESLLFFGRNEQTSELLSRLHENHFVAVVGSSGCGKSSLLKSGLIPALKAGYLVENSDRWMIVIMKPGQNPLTNLVGALLEQIKPDYGIDDLTALKEKIQDEGSDAIIHLLENYYVEKNINFFLLVDQFEEIFRFATESQNSEKRDDAIDFVNIMLELSKQKEVPMYVVITMRSDFIGECANFNGLAETMNQSQYLVPRLNRIQMKNSILGPARLYGGTITQTLISRLLNEIANTKDELPLLQHALMRIWQWGVQHNTLNLDVEAYEQIGGFGKSLSNHAEEALAGMSNTELRTTQILFQALTTVDEGGRRIRRPKLLSELVALTQTSDTEIKNLINRLNDDRRSFLVVNKMNDSDEMLIDISHESLMRVWTRLTDWVDEEADSVKIYERICQSALLYGKGQAGLWRDPELQVAIDWQKKNQPNAVWAKQYNPHFEAAISFLEESLKDKKKQLAIQSRRRKTSIAVVSIFLIALSILTLWANNQRKNAIEQAIMAKKSDKEAQISRLEAENRSLEAENSRRQAEQDKLKATESEARALNQKKIAENQKKIAENKTKIANEQTKLADEMRGKAYEQQRIAEKKTKEAQEKTEQIIESQAKLLKEKMLTTAKNLAMISQNNSFNDDLDLKALLALSAHKFYLKYSEKSWDPSIYSALYLANKALLKPSEYFHNYNSEAVNSVHFMPLSNSIASIDDDGYLIISSPSNISARPIKFNQQKFILEQLAVSKDGKNIAVTSETKYLLIYDVDKPSIAPRPIEYKDADKFLSVTYTNDKLIASTNRNTILVYNTSNYSLLKTISLDSKPLCMDVFSANNTLVVGTDKGQVYNIDLKQFTSTKIIDDKNLGLITSISTKPLGKSIVFGNYRGQVYLIEDYKKGTMTMLGSSHKSKISKIQFNPTENKFATASLDGTIKYWNLDVNGEIPVCFCSEHNGYVLGIDFNTNGNYLTSCGKDMTVRIYPINQKLLIESLQSKVNRNLTQSEWENYIGVNIPFENLVDKK